jgi:hypothetical protein
LDDNADNNKQRQNITAKEGIGYYGLKQHNPRIDEVCSKLLDQGKQAKSYCRIQDKCR